MNEIRCAKCGELIRNEMFIAGADKCWHMNHYNDDPEVTKRLVREALAAVF